MNAESLPRWRRLLRRHRWTIAALLIALVFSVPLIRKERALNRLYQKGGGVYTHPGWLRKSVPPKLNSLIRSKDAARSFARNWGRRLEDFQYLWWRNPEATDEDFAVLAPYLHSLHTASIEESGITDDGLKYFREATNLVELNLDDTRVTGQGLVHLKNLEKLYSLSLRDTRTGDDGLVHLAHLPLLKQLDLSGTLVTDEGIVHLRKVESLTALYLPTADFSDAALETLRGMPNLSTLSFFSTNELTPEGLSQLATLPNLKRLNLDAENLTDDHLIEIGRLTQLTRLSLRGWKITNAGLRHLRGLTLLEYLDLQRTAITDEGLPHLYGLSNLDWVDLQRTKVTKAGVAKLKAAVPGSRVAGGK